MNDASRKVIIVGEVTIHAVASDEPDPYGQGGFSSVGADVVVLDQPSAAALKESFSKKRPVTVRCGALEIVGLVGRYTKTQVGAAVVMALDEMRMTKPDEEKA